MSRYLAVRPLALGPDGPVEEVVPDRLGAEPLARRRALVPRGPARRRLRDQAETLARAGHPGIATVVDIVEVDEQAIEVLRTLGTDGSLADRAATGPLPVPELHGLLRTLADALAAAHRVGVPHGHIATTNVVLHDGAPLLTDFGLADARAGRAETDPFRRDTVQLAELGRSLIDPDDVTVLAASLHAALTSVADDPAAGATDLAVALELVGVPPTEGAAAPPSATTAPDVDHRPDRAITVLAGAVALAVGVLLGAAFVLVP